MGMLLRRREIKTEVSPKVNGKPVVKAPKTKKLNLEPDYVKKQQTQTVVNPTVTKF